MDTKTASMSASPVVRWALILAFALLAFFASYRFAIAANTTSAGTPGKAPSAVAGKGACGSGGASGTGASSSGGGCCGGGAAAPASAKQPKAAEVAGDIQKISVDVSKGYYDPSTIELKAGVPAEITFSQSSGCTAQVQSADLGFSEDLSSGPKTVKLGALKAGTYSFACGMQMVFGSIVVK